MTRFKFIAFSISLLLFSITPSFGAGAGIVLGGAFGKGIKKLPNKDASMFTDEKKRNAIKQGQLNNSRGGFEKQSIAFQIQRSALRRARSKGYRPHAKKYTQCC